MIILPDRNIPRSKILMPMRRESWSPSQRTCTFGIENQTRYRLTARLNDGFLAWQEWFDDREDADAFVDALFRKIVLKEPIPKEILRLSPSWNPLILEQNATFRFDTVTFLTANTGSIQEWRVPIDFPIPLITPGFPSGYNELLAWAAASPTFFTSGTSDTPPSDWNNGDNYVETIGAGGSGGASHNGGSNQNITTGGGGGAYSKSTNLTLSGTITYSIGTGTANSAANGSNESIAGVAGGDTWFNGATLAASSVGAKGGGGGEATSSSSPTFSGGAGGASASGIGSTKYSGGNGGAVSGTTTNEHATGGGGAAGPNGAGTTAAAQTGTGSTTTATDGGSGDNGSGGAGGTATTGGTNITGGAGGNGTEWDASHGAGGGGGGAATSSNTNATGGSAGAYGGGGGAVSNIGTSTDTNAPAGSQGLIVITYSGVRPISFALNNYQIRRIRRMVPY